VYLENHGCEPNEPTVKKKRVGGGSRGIGDEDGGQERPVQARRCAYSLQKFETDYGRDGECHPLLLLIGSSRGDCLSAGVPMTAGPGTLRSSFHGNHILVPGGRQALVDLTSS